MWNVVLSSVSSLRQALEKVCSVTFFLSLSHHPQGCWKIHITFGILDWWVKMIPVLLNVWFYKYYLFSSTQLHYGVPILCKDVFFILLLYKAAWWRSTSLAVSSNLSLILFCSRIGLKRICRAAKQFISLPYPWWLVANSCNLWWKFSTAPFHISWTRDLLQEVFISVVFDLHLVLLCLENRVGNGKDMIKNGKDVVIWSEMTGAQQRLIQS